MQGDLFFQPDPAAREEMQDPATVSDMSIFEIYRKVSAATEMPFVWTFSLPLRKFWSNAYGFDIVKFDEVLFNGQGTLIDNIQQRYGDMAVALVELLIARPAVMAEWLSSTEATFTYDQKWQHFTRKSFTFKTSGN